MKYIDLTRKLNSETILYSDDDYSDPPFIISEWGTIQENNFRVSKVELGTQTGTHIDAPAHFSENGDTLECLHLNNMFGSYLLLNELDIAILSPKKLKDKYHDEKFLFLRSTVNNKITIGLGKFEVLLSLPVKVWIIMQEIEIKGKKNYYFNRILAERDKYLIEDLENCENIPEDGEIVAVPLNLQNVSGSPCRVILRF